MKWVAQSAFTCSNLTIETLEQGVNLFANKVMQGL